MSGATSNSPFYAKALSVEVKVPAGIKKQDYRTTAIETSALSDQRISLKNYRIEAGIECYGQTSAVAAQIRIHNLPYDLMCALSGYGSNSTFIYATNEAGDIAAGADVVEVSLFTTDNTWDTVNSSVSSSSSKAARLDAAERRLALTNSLVFRGSLTNAMASMDAAPDPFLALHCNTMNKARLVPSDVISWKGSVPAATIARQLAERLGVTFEDSGVTTVLQNPYFQGSAAEQLRRVAEQGLFDYIVERGTLAIWPIGGFRKPIGSGITISPRNGLIGYPAFDGVGVSFRTIYNPALRYGDQITLDTDAPNVAGKYRIYGMSHNLSSQVPDGEWFTDVKASFASSPIGQAFGE